MPRAPFDRNIESCAAWIDGHAAFIDDEVEGIVDMGYRRTAKGTGVWDLSIVCPGHYAFERENVSLEQLWREAQEVYGDPAYSYKGGCMGSCLGQ